MPDQETITIAELDIDQGELLKKTVDLKEQITALTDKTKELEAINKILRKGNQQNTEQYQKNAAQIEVNKAQTKSLSDEYRHNQGTLTALTASEQGQIGTLQQLAIRNKELRNEVKTLDLSRKEGRTRLMEINKELDKNNNFIKQNADATLKQKLNIGNYQSALQGLPGPTAAAISAGKGLLQLFNALIANPVGLILAAIALAIKAIADAISKNQHFMDRFKAIGDGLRASYDALLDRINGVARAIKSLGDINFKNIREGFRGLGQEMVEEFKAAKQLREELQRLEDQEIGDIVRKAELKRSIELLRLESKDEQITETERLKLIDQAIALEQQLLDIELEAARERARISQEQIDLGESTRKEIEENARLQARVIELETESLKRIRTLASERKTVALKAAEEQRAAAEQAALEAAKAVDNEIRLEMIKSIAFEEIHSNDEERAIQRAETLKTIQNQVGANDLEVARLVASAKLDIAQNYLKGIAELFGRESKIGKLAAIAETTINTYRAAQSAYAAMAGIPVVGPGLGIAAAGAATLAGIANVKKILKVNSGLPGDTGGGGGPQGLGGVAQQAAGNFTVTKNQDGGISTRNLIQTTAIAVKQGVKEALEENPQERVLVVDDVTAKQSGIGQIEKTATV